MKSDPTYQKVTKLHSELLDSYVRELREIKPVVEDWWSALIAKEQGGTSDPATALARVHKRWPSGPGVHPMVVAIVRKYYFECLLLNRAIEFGRADPVDVEQILPHSLDLDGNQGGEEADEPVNPSILLTEGLITPATEDLSEFVGAALTYWPIGMTQNGELT